MGDTTYIPEDVDFLKKNKELYTHYPYDILNTYFVDERTRIYISGKNHQNARDYLIEVIKVYAKNRKYSFNTVHLAALFIDAYMDSFILSEEPEHQKFISLVALLLAAKIEENDDLVPSIKELLYVVDLSDELGFDIKLHKENENCYKPAQVSAAYKSYLKLYCTIEYTILRVIKFNAIRPTAMTFLNVFQNITVTEGDLKDATTSGDWMGNSMLELNHKVTYYLKQLSEILLHEISFHQYLPSKVAAAMIATTRKLLKLKTVWTLQLEFLTHTSLAELEPIMNVFMYKMISVDESTEEILFCDSGFQSNDQESYDSTSFECEDEIESLHITKKQKTEN